MILKNKKIVKTVALSLVLALTVGSFIILKTDSKADSVNENEVVVNNDYKEFIDGFRKDGVDITITSEEELYNEFDKYEVVDETSRENILAATDDEVLMNFIENESKQFIEIDKNMPDKSIFSESLEETIEENYSDFITNVDTLYFKRGQDGYKKVTTLTNKYGGAEVVNYEIRMNVIQGADSNHPTKCGMMVTQQAKLLKL